MQIDDYSKWLAVADSVYRKAVELHAEYRDRRSRRVNSAGSIYEHSIIYDEPAITQPRWHSNVSLTPTEIAEILNTCVSPQLSAPYYIPEPTA